MQLLWSSIVGSPVLAPLEEIEGDPRKPDALRVAKRDVSADGRVPADKGFPLQIVGHVSAAFVNPETGQLIALLVGYTQVLSPMDIHAWDSDHLEIHSAEDLGSADDLVRLQEFGLRRCFFAAKSVWWKNGKKVGRLYDFTLDTTTGQVLSIQVSKHFLFWDWDFRIFPATDISEITESKILLTVDEAHPEKAQKEAPLTEPLLVLSSES